MFSRDLTCWKEVRSKRKTYINQQLSTGALDQHDSCWAEYPCRPSVAESLPIALAKQVQVDAIWADDPFFTPFPPWSLGLSPLLLMEPLVSLQNLDRIWSLGTRHVVFEPTVPRVRLGWKHSKENVKATPFKSHRIVRSFDQILGSKNEVQKTPIVCQELCQKTTHCGGPKKTVCSPIHLRSMLQASPKVDWLRTHWSKSHGIPPVPSGQPARLAKGFQWKSKIMINQYN